MVLGGYVTKIRLIVLGLLLLFFGLFYIGSIYVAYNKGYNKHALETIKEAAEVVMGSHTDLLNAAKEVKENEKNIKMDETCSAVWSFDLRECLHN